MKKILYLLASILLSLPIQAQNELTIDKEKMQEADVNLGGKSGVDFIARTKDLIIKTNNPSDAIPEAKSNGKGEYIYSMLLDITTSKERRFNISRKGTTFMTDPLVKKGLKPNHKLTFLVEGLASWQTFLELVKQSMHGAAHFVQGEACIEFTTELSDLKVEPSKHLKYKINHSKSATGANVIQVIIDTHALKANKEGNQAVYQDILKNTIKVYGEGTNVVQMPAADMETVGSNVKIPYTVSPAIKTAFKEATFDELITTAREYWADYPQHAESSFYDAARIAYDKALGHKDCPQGQLEAIRAERDTMASIRRTTYLMEMADKKARQFESEKGFESDEVYRYLGGEARFADRILQYHPEIKKVQQIRDELIARLQKHPKGQNVTEEVVTKQRETLSGRVSFKNEYMAMPFSKMRVYATTSPTIQSGQSHYIGKVNEDGTYSVVKPDNIKPLYIYVTGEKDNAHLVNEGQTRLDIVVKDKY